MEEIKMFKKAKTNKLYENVIIQIKGLIETKVLAYGDMLPSEEELSNSIGVGRSSVREGLRVLEILGFVETIRGKGTYVKYKTDEKIRNEISDILNEFKSNLHEINEFNSMIMTSAAKQAAMVATTEHIHEIETILIDSRKRIETGEYNEEDLIVFTNKIAEIIGNKLLIHILNNIHDTDKLNRRIIVSTPNRPYENIKEFNEVYVAIKNKDGAKAYESMEDHFKNVREILDKD
jgi:GntR family transcriptional repressor for pyruvate dehydrogenase complex